MTPSSESWTITRPALAAHAAAAHASSSDVPALVLDQTSTLISARLFAVFIIRLGDDDPIDGATVWGGRHLSTVSVGNSGKDASLSPRARLQVRQQSATTFSEAVACIGRAAAFAPAEMPDCGADGVVPEVCVTCRDWRHAGAARGLRFGKVQLLD